MDFTSRKQKVVQEFEVGYVGRCPAVELNTTYPRREHPSIVVVVSCVNWVGSEPVDGKGFPARYGAD